MSVSFTETGEQRELRRACNRCYGRAVKVADIDIVWLVSQYGTVHQTHPDESGRTLCGIDATGPRWWWRE